MKAIIYQKNEPTFRIDPDKRLYDKNEYKKVYVLELNERQERQFREDVDALLEEMFEIFNIRRPRDFEGHSLSVEDVVEFRDLEEVEMETDKFICDCFGWRRIEWEDK